MIWPALKYQQREAAQRRGVRVRRQFALWPMLVDLNEDPPVRVWLESYWVIERF